MNIPSKIKCFNLIEKMGMMDHIIDHSLMVSNVALALCLKLKKEAPRLDTRLTVCAALLHDITKTRSFDTNESHSETGGQVLTRLGYPEVGDIIRQHVILDTYDHNAPVTEKEIVNYADKRVLHDKVVPLEKRLEYIKTKYGNKKEFKANIQFMWEKTRFLENKLFSRLDIMPAQLPDVIEKKIRISSSGLFHI